MIKQGLATAALVLTLGVVSVAPASADSGSADESPQLSLISGSLNKLCLGIPIKADIQSLVALVNVGVQDIPILSARQNQQCTENSTQAKGDEPLSHILDDIPILSSNGVGSG